MDREILRTVMLQTLTKRLRGERLTRDERLQYNEWIRTGQALSPIHIRCSQHRNDVLIYDTEEDMGANFQRLGDQPICVRCGMSKPESVEVRTYDRI